MAEGIDDTISLHLIDTRQLVEEAKKIREAEKLADKADVVKKRLAEGKAPFVSPDTEEDVLPRGFEPKITDDNLIAGLGPLVEKKVEEVLDQKQRQRPLTSSTSPISSPADNEALPKGFFQGTPQTRAGAVTGAKTENAFKEAIKKQKELESELKKLKTQQSEFANSFKRVSTTLSGASSTLTNLTPAAIAGRLGMIGGPAGIVIGAVVSTAFLVVDGIMKQFERGGVFSTKLKFPQQALTLNNVEDDNAYRSGTKYITDDLRVVQKAPNSSNTANLKYEMIRYTVENGGR